MSQYVYSPDTGEIINTVAPAMWMGTTNIAPPLFDATSTSVFFINGTWVISPHNPVLATEILAKTLSDYQNSARLALIVTDATFARIQESIILGNITNADIAVVTWVNYRKALRAAISTSVPGVLPVKPTIYPSGT